MILVKTCNILLFLLSIHCVCGDYYNVRFKRLAVDNQTLAKTNLKSVVQTTDVSEVTSSPTLDKTQPTSTVETTKSSSSQTIKGKKLDSVSLKTNTKSGIQIPVQVVYDQPPGTPIGDQRANPNIRPNGQRYRKIRKLKPHNRQFNETKRHPTSTTESPITKNENTVTAKVTSSAPSKSARKLENLEATPKTVKTIRKRPPVVPIIDSENRVYSHKGEFHYSYESGDGTKAFEKSEQRQGKNINEPANAGVVGGFSYTDKEGNDFSLSYTADENGYHPTGAHLPTPPPIPPAIARALQYLATKPTPDPDTVTGKYFIDY